jgi:hypothetical protein
MSRTGTFTSLVSTVLVSSILFFSVLPVASAQPLDDFEEYQSIEPGSPEFQDFVTFEGQDSALDKVKRSSALLMPMFYLTSDGRHAALFALRNSSSQSIRVAVVVVMADGRESVDTITLAARKTETVNLRDLNLPTITSGASFGYILFQVVNSSNQAVQSRALTGDYFLVDAAGNFASGGSLIAENETCRKFATRFADGGVFDGTRFYFTMPVRSSSTYAVIADFKVYDERGKLADSGTFSSSRRATWSTTSSMRIAGVNLPRYGTIEWSFRSNVGPVFASFEMSASGRFSVGVAGACLD